jgi:hypothetical protein
MTTKIQEKKSFKYNNRLFRIDIVDIDPVIKEQFTQERKARNIAAGELFNEIWKDHLIVKNKLELIAKK